MEQEGTRSLVPRVPPGVLTPSLSTNPQTCDLFHPFRIHPWALCFDCCGLHKYMISQAFWDGEKQLRIPIHHLCGAPEIRPQGYFCKRFCGQVPNFFYHKVYPFNLADSWRSSFQLICLGGKIVQEGECNTSYLPKSAYHLLDLKWGFTNKWPKPGARGGGGRQFFKKTKKFQEFPHFPSSLRGKHWSGNQVGKSVPVSPLFWMKAFIQIFPDDINSSNKLFLVWF